MDGTHYLKLAYLAETSLVFNLAYIELKWRKEFNNLSSKMDSYAALSSNVGTGRDNRICQKHKCKKCDDISTQADIFDKYDTEYLSKLSKVIHSHSSEENDANNINGNKLSTLKFISTLFTAWSKSNYKMFNPIKYLLCLFHLIARKNLDRTMSFILLIISTIMLIVMTMADNRIDFIYLLNYIGIWDSSDHWISAFLNILTISIIIPGIFWASWHIFLEQYECLSMRLIDAYQKKSKGQFQEDVMNNLK